MRKIVLAAIIIFGLAILLFTVTKRVGNQFEVKTYFRDARGLRAGASVRVAGVDVGQVAEVRVQPELVDGPAEVVLQFQTPYELKIPSDSVVSLNRAGLLGDIYPEIHLGSAFDAPITNHGVLKSKE